MCASFITFSDSRKGFAVRFRIWAKAILLGAPLFGGLTALAQYGAPATPAPYNPVALAEVTVRAGRRWESV
jgi:hypothetical protein